MDKWLALSQTDFVSRLGFSENICLIFKYTAQMQNHHSSKPKHLQTWLFAEVTKKPCYINDIRKEKKIKLPHLYYHISFHLLSLFAKSVRFPGNWYIRLGTHWSLHLPRELKMELLFVHPCWRIHKLSEAAINASTSVNYCTIVPWKHLYVSLRFHVVCRMLVFM